MKLNCIKGYRTNISRNDLWQFSLVNEDAPKIGIAEKQQSLHQILILYVANFGKIAVTLTPAENRHIGVIAMSEL
jgi:hypothetical protein